MIPRRPLLAAPALLASTELRALTPPLHASAPVRQDDAVAQGWRRDVLSRWGDRVTFDAPPFNPAIVDGDGASAQFGWDARVVGLAAPPPAADGVARAVLAVAHPTVDPALAFPGGRERPEVTAALQGATLLNLEFQGGRWIVVDGGFQARRLTATTLCRASGPLADSLGGAIRGVLAVRGGCVTPWNTLLLAEGDPGDLAPRLGIARTAPYGWVAELDPLDPHAVPAKRTALGRAARGDAAAALSRDGRAVVFSTQRVPSGFLFRFVSAGPASAADALDAGQLAVAVPSGGGLRWAPLPPAAAADPADAARALGAAPFDVPSGCAWDARGGRLLLCVPGAAGRSSGALLALRPQGGDPAAEAFAVETLLRDATFRPDTVMAAADGRVLVGTDQGPGWSQTADTLSILDGPASQWLYAAARGAAVGGAAVTPDGRTIITAARMPGRAPGASFERPSTRWPEFQPGVPPRSALISLTR
jgi:secreted PhoX family phosphatase